MSKRKTSEEYRLELGLKLKALRSEAGLSGPQLARKLGISQSKVSKIENGRTMPTVDDVLQFAEALDATQAAREDLLSHIRDLATQVNGWQGRIEGGIRHRSRQMAEIEADSTEIRNFQQAIVPGLLQTPQYARKMFQLEPLALAEEEIPGAVAARMDRQTALYNPEKQIEFVIVEPSLRYPFLDGRLMAAQIDRILTATDLDNVDVRILPIEKQKHLIPFCSFTIYDDSMVLVETFTNNFRVYDSADIDVYLHAYDIVQSNALEGAKAVTFLRSIRADFLKHSKS